MFVRRCAAVARLASIKLKASAAWWVQDAAGNWVRNASAAALSAVLQPQGPLPQLPSVSAAVHSINSLLWRLALAPPSLPTSHPPGVPFPSQLSLAFGRAVLLKLAVQLVPSETGLQGPSPAVQPLGPGNITAGSTMQLLVASAEPGQRLPAELLACALGMSGATSTGVGGCRISIYSSLCTVALRSCTRGTMPVQRNSNCTVASLLP